MAHGRGGTPRRTALAYERAAARGEDHAAPDLQRGYAVTGVRFASGHALELRRVVASTGVPAATAVWHRLPSGEWRMYSDSSDDVHLAWGNPWSLTVHVRSARIAWAVHLHATPLTRALNALLGWPMIRALALRLTALRQAWAGAAGDIRRLRCLWLVDASTAWIDGRHAGPLVMARARERVDGHAIPRRGFFIFGAVNTSSPAPRHPGGSHGFQV